VAEKAFGIFHSPVSPYVFTALALGELGADKSSFIPKRTDPGPVIGRLTFGALCGGALQTGAQTTVAGVAAGLAGALLGTFGGFVARGRLAELFGGKDLPAALIEDAVALGLATLAVTAQKTRSG
jgi:uncharacterized membrane protein